MIIKTKYGEHLMIDKIEMWLGLILAVVSLNK